MSANFPSYAIYRRDSGSYDPVTKRYVLPIGVNSTGRRMLFSGPDGIRNHVVPIVPGQDRYVGIGTMSPEGTGDLNYIYRPSSRDMPTLRPKHRRVGEIGWGISKFSSRESLNSGNQLKRGEFWQTAENRHTHLYQNPWTPHPYYPHENYERPKTSLSQPRGDAHFTGRPYSALEHHRLYAGSTADRTYESSSQSSCGQRSI